eukprot:1023713-Alexandrium_andersonii.AAC.1
MEPAYRWHLGRCSWNKPTHAVNGDQVNGGVPRREYEDCWGDDRAFSGGADLDAGLGNGLATLRSSTCTGCG